MISTFMITIQQHLVILWFPIIPEAEHGLPEGDCPLPGLEGLVGDLVLPPRVHLLQSTLPE